MSLIYFIRHGETDMAGRFCGHTDPELNARGWEQARGLTLQGVEQVYSSDLRRARSTAGALGLPVIERPALREIYFGEWEGLSWEQIERCYPEYAQAWLTQFPVLSAPGGESFREFHARVLKEVNWLLQQRGSMAVVTHAGVLRVFLQHFRGCSAEEAWKRTQAYCCVVTLEGEKHEYCNQTR